MGHKCRSTSVLFYEFCGRKLFWPPYNFLSCLNFVNNTSNKNSTYLAASALTSITLYSTVAVVGFCVLTEAFGIIICSCMSCVYTLSVILCLVFAVRGVRGQSECGHEAAGKLGM